MSNEARIRSSLTIRKGTTPLQLEYSSKPTTFLADVAGVKGPSPGAISVSVYGTDVDLSELEVPGLCRLMNLDAKNYVEYGIWDPEVDMFYPLGEVLPGESYVIRLSRNLREEYGTGTGTGTIGPSTNRLRLVANVATCNVLVEAFEA